MNRLCSRVALVTGAAAGIGAAIARLFLTEGAYVVGGDVEPVSWQPRDARFEPVLLDVTRPDHWRRAVDAAVTRFGGLDILVNGAGLDPADAPGHDAEHVGLEHWRAVQAVNVEGAVLGCQHALPALRRSAHASIVNLSSLAATIGTPEDPAHGASMAAIAAFTKSLALGCAGMAIRCNSLHPGDIRDATSRAPTDADPAVRAPMRRLGDADEVAWAALFLASDDASYITGAELFVDGGLSAT